MNNTFLEDFIESILDNHVGCAGFGDMNVDWSGIKEQINSLGENTRRLLEVGVLMDELEKLGFKSFMNNPFSMHGNGLLIIFEAIWIEIRKDDEEAELLSDDIYLDSPTFKEDLINKVKELINDK